MANADDLRRIALAYPGVSEHPHFDRRAFKGRVTFVTLAADGRSANFKFSYEEQQLKCAVAPGAFSALPNAWGRNGWTEGRLSAMSEAELRAALETAWRRSEQTPARRARLR
jgi:hypothetical protein